MTSLNIIGVIHLLPLPGGPNEHVPFDVVLSRALTDAQTLVENGVSSMIVENFGDAPFVAGQVNPHVCSYMTIVAHEIRRRFGSSINLGINVLRNDPLTSMAVAAASDAQFIRVNVHSGSYWTDQGLIQGQAHQTLMYRKSLQAQSIRIAADVMVKHASPAGRGVMETFTEELVSRAKSDVVIVTGEGTGKEISLNDLKRCRNAAQNTTIWVGSGVSPENIELIRPYADGCIVGTFFHQDANINKPLDSGRIKEVVSKA